MTANTHDSFEEMEIEHNSTTYYVTGYVTYRYTECIGTTYEGYAYEILHDRELCSITINHLWFCDEASDEGIDILHKKEYEAIEMLAEEVIRYKYDS